MAKSRKVILLIVEGETDQDSLSPVLKKIFSNSNVHFCVTRGDILVKTIETDISGRNAITKVNTHIKNEMMKYGYKTKDLLKVVHLIDTDGAFIPNERVIENSEERIKYCIDKIETRNPEWIINRNKTKKEVAQRLRSTKKLVAFHTVFSSSQETWNMFYIYIAAMHL